MKNQHLKSKLVFLILSIISLSANGSDTLRCTIATNYYRDLSDSYGGGGLLSGEFSISKSWYGGQVSFGNFQSQPTFFLKIPVEELGLTLNIPFEEISIMQIGTISGFIRPIQNKWIAADILIGIGYGQVRYLCFKGVDYSYSVEENKFTYLIKDYQLVKTTHFGYQVGFNISFYVLPKMGLQLSSKIQDLSNGGTFFFVGGGLCFRL